MSSSAEGNSNMQIFKLTLIFVTHIPLASTKNRSELLRTMHAKTRPISIFMHAQKLSLPWGASPHVFAQPSKQQSPLLGQSVSLCPGDQQVDTAPCIQSINQSLIFRFGYVWLIENIFNFSNQSINQFQKSVNQKFIFISPKDICTL